MKACDIHCHILPGVDDGAEDIKQARKLLQLACDDGTKAIICTPHYHIGRVVTSVEQNTKAFEKLKILVAKEFPEIRVFLGQEIYYTHRTLEKLKRGELLTMCNSDYVLLEFSHMTDFEVIRDAVYELYDEGFLPIVAHVERYAQLAGKPELVSELIRHGAYIQVNASTVTAGLTNPLRKFAMKLLKNDDVHFIASDAHDEVRRRPELSKAAGIIAKKFGEEKAREIFWDNPKSIIKNEEI